MQHQWPGCGLLNTQHDGQQKDRVSCNVAHSATLARQLFFSILFLLPYTFLKCCFNWHKEKKMAFVGPASLPSQLSNFFSPLCSLSIIPLWFLSSPYFSVSLSLSVSSGSCSLPLLQLNTRLFPTDCLCCSFTPCLLIYISLLSHPLSWLIFTLLCSDFSWTVHTFVSQFWTKDLNQTRLIVERGIIMVKQTRSILKIFLYAE